MMNVVMLNVIMLNVVMLNVVMLNIIMLNIVLLNDVMLNVVILSVMAPNKFLESSSSFKITSLFHHSQLDKINQSICPWQTFRQG